jgi:hypothetical protein
MNIYSYVCFILHPAVIRVNSFSLLLSKIFLECAAARQEPEKAAAVLKYSAMQRLLCYDS